MRFLKTPKVKPIKTKADEIIDNPIFKIAGNVWQTKVMRDDDDPELAPSPAIRKILDTFYSLSKIQPHMPGYPSWYRDLCMKQAKVENDDDDDDETWKPGPQLISTKMRIVPKLLRLTWLGYPLHHDDKHGWGYLVPGLSIDEDEEKSEFPYE
jgi:DNA polymerase gamma 1